MNHSSLFKRNRKKILFLFSSIIILAGFAWWLYPEYGNSYSEQQRRLWNQYLDIYEPIVIDPEWYEEDKDSKDVYAKLGSILEQIDQLNRTGAVPSVPVRLPEKLTEGLPSEKKPSELRHLALSGDGSAALELFCLNLGNRSPYYNKRGEKFGESRSIPSFEQITEQKKCLNQAIKNKRPGSEFLLDLLYNQWMKNYDWNTESMTDTINKGILAGDTHYQEFLSCIRNGDFPLFKYSTGACPNFRSGTVFQEMRKSLRRKAKAGGKEDWRHMMELMISRDIIIIQSKIFQEFDQPYAWAQKLSLPQWIPFQKSFRSQTLSDFRDALSWCKKSADAGDLEAQHLWLQYCLPAQRYLKRSTLNDILSFHQNLIEKGYRPYLKELYYALKQGVPTKKGTSDKKDSLRKAFRNSQYAVSHKIILSQLSAEEMNRLSSQLKKLLFPPSPKSSPAQDDNLRKEWEEAPAHFLQNLHNFLAHSNPQIRELAAQYANQLVEKNNLSAILAYAALYQQGQSVPQDKPRALTLIRKALEIVDKTSPYEFLDGCFSDTMDEAGSNIDFITRVRFIRFNIDTSTPGAKPEEAFHLAQKMFAADQRQKKFEDKPGFILASENAAKDRLCYYLGYMHEHGIGTPKDIKSAAAFYKNGSETTNYSPYDPYSPINLSRLYEEGKGVEQSNEKALEYLKRAQESGWRLTDELKAEVDARIERLEENRVKKSTGTSP